MENESAFFDKVDKSYGKQTQFAKIAWKEEDFSRNKTVANSIVS